MAWFLGCVCDGRHGAFVMKKLLWAGVTTIRFSAAVLIGHLSEKERNLIWVRRGSEGNGLITEVTGFAFGCALYSRSMVRFVAIITTAVMALACVAALVAPLLVDAHHWLPKKREMFGKRDQWRAALIGALICGFVGPEIALLLLTFWSICRSSSIHEATSMLTLPLLWIFAIIPFGPAAFVLGGIGGVLLHSLVRKSPSTRIAILKAGALGLILGATVVVGPLLLGWGPARNVIGSLPLAASTGALCALVVLWLFHRAHLVQSHENPSSLQ